MTTTQSHPQVNEKLDGTSYREWPTSVYLLFDALDLLGHIDGTQPPPTSSKNVVNWDAFDCRMYGVIFQSVAINIRLELLPLKTD